MVPYIVHLEYDNGVSVSLLTTVVYTNSLNNILTLLSKKYVKDSDSMVRIIAIKEMEPDEVM